MGGSRFALVNIIRGLDTSLSICVGHLINPAQKHWIKPSPTHSQPVGFSLFVFVMQKRAFSSQTGWGEEGEGEIKLMHDKRILSPRCIFRLERAAGTNRLAAVPQMYPCRTRD